MNRKEGRRRGWKRVLLEKRKGFHGLPDQHKDVTREDPQLKNAVQAEEKRQEERRVIDVDIHLVRWLSHIHINDDPQVVENGHQAGQDTDDN